MLLIEGLEPGPLAARQALVGGQPEETIGVLADGVHCRTRQPLLQREGAEVVLLSACPGRQKQQGQQDRTNGNAHGWKDSASRQDRADRGLDFGFSTRIFKPP